MLDSTADLSAAVEVICVHATATYVVRIAIGVASRAKLLPRLKLASVVTFRFQRGGKKVFSVE